MVAIVCGILAAGIFLLDFLLKSQIEKKLAAGEIKPFCKGRLLIRKYHNTGVAFDLGAKKQGAVACLSLLLTLVLSVVFLATFTFRGNSTLKAGLAFLLGGAYSNTYDRLVRKYVVDYVSFPVKNKRLRSMVFNLADFCILIGALLMTLAAIQEP
ncbi:MAG: signal peptidase II [Bacteroidales bacterium]|nr:signal peptidase II [Bacteroidales bacterium]MCM1416247.1 signal peptidase II [bacterium]MCM1423135.1 signal peptidase II [bacterium]